MHRPGSTGSEGGRIARRFRFRERRKIRCILTVTLPASVAARQNCFADVASAGAGEREKQPSPRMGGFVRSARMGVSAAAARWSADELSRPVHRDVQANVPDPMAVAGHWEKPRSTAPGAAIRRPRQAAVMSHFQWKQSDAEWVVRGGAAAIKPENRREGYQRGGLFAARAQMRRRCRSRQHSGDTKWYFSQTCPARLPGTGPRR